jgi:hypothetical protein
MGAEHMKQGVESLTGDSEVGRDQSVADTRDNLDI